MRKVRLKWLAIVVAILLVFSGLIVWFLEASSSADKIRVACVGDSITAGSKYPYELGVKLGANYTVRNYGVGLAAVSLESEKPYMNQTEFSEAKAFLPNIVIIMLGTNDAKPAYQQYLDNFTDDYKKLIIEFQSLSSKPKIWIVVPPPIFNDGFGPNSTLLVQDIIPRIKQVPNETGLPLIDFYSDIVNHPEYFSDGVHPNPEGAKIIASKVYDAIR